MSARPSSGLLKDTGIRGDRGCINLHWSGRGGKGGGGVFGLEEGGGGGR